MNKPKYAISYLRYSTKEQAKGESEARQIKWTKEYCDANSMKLMDVYKDLGISAHRGKHSQKGNLATLLEDCGSGKIPKGYALIIENFDRLSREEVPVALQRFLTLINDYELEIHTLDDKMVYSPGKIDITQLIISIVIMGRAHSESARKSVFVSKAWEQKRERKKAYSKPGKKPMGRHPNWLSWNSEDQSWIVDVKAQTTIEYIFELCTSGKFGRYHIAQRLNNENIGVFSKRATKWTAAMVKRITNNQSLLGRFVPSKSKDRNAKTIEGYYPVLIDQELFKEAQRGFDSRNSHETGAPVKHKHSYSILTGIGYYKGSRIHKGYYKKRNSDEVIDTYGCTVNNKNTYYGYAERINHFVCSLISELDDRELSPNLKNVGYELKLETELEDKVLEEENIKVKITRYTEAVGVSDDIPELVRELHKNKQDLLKVEDQIINVKKCLLDLKNSSGIHSREEVSRLKKSALVERTLDARQELQVALKQLIKRLDLYKDVDELPDDGDFKDHALMLHATAPIKYWARIVLFNDHVILGAMTAEGQIARIRWEE